MRDGFAMADSAILGCKVLMRSTLISLNPSYLWSFFSTKKVECNLRIKNLVKLPQIKTHTFGTHSLTFRGSIL